MNEWTNESRLDGSLEASAFQIRWIRFDGELLLKREIDYSVRLSFCLSVYLSVETELFHLSERDPHRIRVASRFHS